MKYTVLLYVIHYMKRTNIQNIAIITFIAILIGTVGYLFYTRNAPAKVKTYTNSTYGVSFEYPKDYQLTETTLTEEQKGTMVTIIEKGVSIPVSGEGPTSISIGLYKGTATPAAKENTLDAWIKNSPNSNWKIAKQTTPGVTTTADQSARLYTWDGLYLGTTVVTLHKGNVLMFSVTYDGETDLEKREAFTKLIASLKLTEPNSTGTSTVGVSW